MGGHGFQKHTKELWPRCLTTPAMATLKCPWSPTALEASKYIRMALLTMIIQTKLGSRKIALESPSVLTLSAPNWQNQLLDGRRSWDDGVYSFSSLHPWKGDGVSAPRTIWPCAPQFVSLHSSLPFTETLTANQQEQYWMWCIVTCVNNTSLRKFPFLKTR